MGRWRRAGWFGLALGIVAADRATKVAIELWTTERFQHVMVPGLVTLVHGRNPGIAFGLLADRGSPRLTALLIASSVAVIAVLCWLLARDRTSRWRSRAGLASILGGASGNLIDRLLHGRVTDFLEVRLGSYRWPAFNVADAAITIGAALLIFEMLLRQPRSTEKRA